MSEEMTVLMARYPSQQLAETDFTVIRNMHNEGVVPLDDLAVVIKNPEGHVEITKNIHHGVFKGVIIGAVLALLSPLSLVVGAIGGAVVGKLVRVMQPGITRKDMLELGQFLDDSSVMIVAVGPPAGIEVVDAALGDATMKMRKTIGADGQTVRKTADEPAE